MARSGAWQSACVHTRPGLSLIGRLIVCAYIAAACYASALTAIINPFKGLSPKSTNSTSRSPFLSLSLFFFSSIFFPPYSPCCLCFAVFSVIRNGIASDRLAAERTGSFTREWSICRARRVPCFLFSRFYTLGVLLVNCLTCCLRVSFLSFFSSSWCGYFWD